MYKKLLTILPFLAFFAQANEVLVTPNDLHTYENGMPSVNQKLNAKIATLNAGDKLIFEEGEYYFNDEPINFKSRVYYEGRDTLSTPTFKTNGDDIVRLTISNKEHIRFNHISFNRITLNFTYSDNISILNSKFVEGLDYVHSNPYPSQQISFALTNTFTVKNNEFYRNSVMGRGITTSCSFYGEIRDNKIIGKYVTGISVSSMTENCTNSHLQGTVNIVGNDIQRSSNSASDLEDHGIYLQTAKNVTVYANQIAGWSNEASGFSLKLRNSENVRVIGNEFVNSGIIVPTYEYDLNCSLIETRHIHDVVIRNNIFDTRHVVGNRPNEVIGISFYRNSQKNCSANGFSDNYDYEANICFRANSYLGVDRDYHLHNSDTSKFEFDPYRCWDEQ